MTTDATAVSNAGFSGARPAVPPILDRYTVRVRQHAGLPAALSADHLRRLGARAERARSRRDTSGAAAAWTVKVEGAGGTPSAASRAPVMCVIGWENACEANREATSTEPLVQALSGLMAVHGRSRGGPARLGLDVSSVAAGVVATQGILAALIARARGREVRRVETSVLQGALLFLSHHLAIASSGTRLAGQALGAEADRRADAVSGPPFPTRDGQRVEVEAVDFNGWTAFWNRLGVSGQVVDAGWGGFAYRYLSASCLVPRVLHEAVARHTFDEIRAAAESAGLTVRRVRGYDELLADLARQAPFDTPRSGSAPPLPAPWQIEPVAGAPTRAPARLSEGEAPLAGMRVIEAATRLQGPIAGLLLQMLGAEVLKVEPPGGDIGRAAPAGPLRAAYLAYNRGKRVVEIDLKRPEGRAELLDLVGGANVFLHNWRVGRAERLGLDASALHGRNAGLVYAHASGWGPAAADGTGLAGESVVQAHAGCADGLSPCGEVSVPSRLTLVDVLGGLLACEGVLAGLLLRQRQGHGCRVDTSLLGGALVLQADVLHGITSGRERQRRHGRPLWGALDRPLATLDGYIVLAAADARTRARLATAVGLPPTAVNGGSLDERVAERLRDRSASDWERLLRGAGIPAARVQSDITEATDDPRIVRLLERAENGSVVPAMPWRFVG